MGYYIEVPENTGKVRQLVQLYNAKIISCPKSLEEILKDKALICVVGNGSFDAAGYCYSVGEFEAFKFDDGRPRQWLLMDKKLAEKLTGFRQ